MNKLYFALAFFLIVHFNFAQHQSAFWGMTYAGGNGGGVVFKTNGYGDSLEIAHNFINQPGRNPLYSQLCEASGGKLYGLTFGGGPYDGGVLFEFDAVTGTYTPKVIFNGTTDGKNPYGSLTLASNGKLYGMTQSGGANNLGVLFEYDPSTEVFTKKIDFLSATTGRNPFGSLIMASNGLLYGLTSGGGVNNMGVLFEFNPANGILTKKWDFDGTNSGRNPYGTLMQASGGKLYGMTFSGGTSNMGVLFEYDISTGIITKKVDFDGIATGRGPYGSLAEFSNGMLYGMTSQGGTNSLGVLFEYNPATAVLTKKIDFDGPLAGRSPYGTLINACGVLTGMTSGGGANNKGVLFDFDPTSGILTRKLDFDGLSTGSTPFGTLTFASNGKIYGVTNSGGQSNSGVIFEFDCMTNSYAKKVDFAVTTNGGFPYGSFIYAKDKMLYANTTYGGQNDFGVLFRINPTGNVFTKLLDYNNVTNGGFPVGKLSEAANGKMYGMTYSGGLYDKGTMFEFDPTTGINTIIRNLDSTTTGSYPYGSVLETSAGNLYGMTSFGGNNNFGTIFSYNYISDVFTSKMSFDGTATGSNPYCDFIMAGNGKLYAMTYSGGLNDLGILFEYDISSDVFTKKIDFTGISNGANPYGSLTLASNGKLYGLTSKGGSANMGVLFEFDPVNSVFTKKIDFTGVANGGNPEGSLMESSGGKLYGVTRTGGINNLGVLFEFDPTTGLLLKKFDFDANNGKNPYYTKLVEVCNAPMFVTPVSDASVCLNENTFFKCFPTGNWLTYQWQVNMGAGFSNIADNAMYSGAQTDSLHLDAVPAVMNNYLYRCIVTSTCPDSVIISNNAILHVRPHYEFAENQEICDNESYFWRENTYNIAGTYYDSLTTQFGCDSVFILNLITHPTYETDFYAEICDNESYLWRGSTYNNAGTYYDSLYTVHGCDSVFILHLIEHPTYVTLSEIEICNNQSYLWRGNTYNNAGTYCDSLTTIFGCDSVFILNLIVHPTYENVHNAEICDNENYFWRGNTYINPGTYYDSLTSMHGCDSVFILHLFVHPTFEIQQSAEICDNESYNWRGNTYHNAGIYYDSLNTVFGCDSVFVLNLIVHPTYENVHNAEICDNDSYLWRGNTYYNTGTYYNNLSTMHGCDSVFILNLKVHHTYLHPQVVRICDNESYFWQGNIYTNTGVYYDSLTTIHGCDSVLVLALLVYPTFEFIQHKEICDNESYLWRGTIYQNTGVYYDSLTTINGCDSVYVLNLIVNPTYEFVQNAVICDNESYQWRGNTYFNSGTYYDNLNSVNGCDSIYVLNLLVYPTYEISQYAEICNNETYSWRGFSLNTTGIYYDSLITQNGCDSVFILNLIVHPTYVEINEVEVCDNGNYFWHGNTYNSTGTYYDSLNTINGCDSIHVLNLIVHPTFEFSENAEICSNENYFWRGNLYNTSGTYYDSLLTTHACDSIYILNLIVKQAYEFTEHAEICAGETYFWRGNNYDTSGAFYDSLQSQTSCDSVYVLDLIVHPVYLISDDIDVCSGDVFSWHGNNYSISGIYYDSLQTQYGCDSVHVLNLIVHPLPVVEINLADSVFCIYNPPALLSANPAGGTFSGQGMSGNIFDPAAAGIGTWPVEYTYSDTNGCENSALVNIVVDDCAGIEQLNNGTISVFPNPTSGKLNITFPAEDDYTLSFIDALGQIVQTTQISAQKTVQLDLNSFAPGVYMLKIENAEGFVLKRVVLEQ